MTIYKIKKTEYKHLRQNVMYNKVWIEHIINYTIYKKGKIFGFWHEIPLCANNLEEAKKRVAMYHEVYSKDNDYKIIEE